MDGAVQATLSRLGELMAGIGNGSDHAQSEKSQGFLESTLKSTGASPIS
jgi:hypothetical protein